MLIMLTSCGCVVLHNTAYYCTAYFFICIAAAEIGNFTTSMVMIPENKQDIQVHATNNL